MISNQPGWCPSEGSKNVSSHQGELWLTQVNRATQLLFRNSQASKFEIADKRHNKTISVDDLSSPCVVYSFGSRNDFSFESHISRKYECEIHIFDCTVVDVDENKLPGGSKYHKICLADAHGMKAVQSTRFKDLSTIMLELKHAEIDILKFDIEGFEFGVLSSLSAPSAHQILVETHIQRTKVWDSHHLPPHSAEEWISAFSNLKKIGYEFASMQQQNDNACRTEWLFTSPRRRTQRKEMCGQPSNRLTPTCNLFISKPRCASTFITDSNGFDRLEYHRIGRRMRHSERYLACVRNPYDLVVSWFTHHKYTNKISEEVKNRYPHNINEWILGGCKTHWDDWLTNESLNGLNPLVQWQWISGVEDKVDLVRYENIHADLSALGWKCNMTGFRNDSPFNKRQKLNSSAIAKINKMFGRDFEMFNYQKLPIM